MGSQLPTNTILALPAPPAPGGKLGDPSHRLKPIVAPPAPQSIVGDTSYLPSSILIPLLLQLPGLDFGIPATQPQLS